jgi:hypothetical protein
MGGTYSTRRRDAKELYSENLKLINYLKDIGVDGLTILKWILKNVCRLARLIQCTNHWRALLYSAMKLQVPKKKAGDFLTS